MQTVVLSGATIGLNSIPIEVEVDSTPGLYSFTIVGLPDKAVEESKERIGAAIKNSGFIAPKQKNRRIIVNLAPADIRKQGPSYDLPIAIGYLISTGQIKPQDSKKRLIAGELSLNGALRPISGVLLLASMAKEQDFDEIIVPKDNLQEARMVNIKSIIGADTLKSVADHLQHKHPIPSSEPIDYKEILSKNPTIADDYNGIVDMSYISGQESAKRAIIIAASGGHNILMYGPPGSGKTLLAKALPGILPDMTPQEMIEVTKIYSIGGLTKSSKLRYRRSFRSPHHTASAIALIGGGASPRPGEISLAHRGVLFLDEFPEFPRNVIEALRQPLEEGKITVSRASSSITFPARFILAAAMNPCPCGNYGNEYKACICPPNAVYRYRNKISGPVLDRIDIQIAVPYGKYIEIKKSQNIPTSEDIKKNVIETRKRQLARFKSSSIYTNSEMGLKDIETYCTLNNDSKMLLKKALQTYAISTRGHHKILKIARTIADLDGMENIETRHIAEAISYRTTLETMGQ